MLGSQWDLFWNTPFYGKLMWKLPPVNNNMLQWGLNIPNPQKYPQLQTLHLKLVHSSLHVEAWFFREGMRAHQNTSLNSGTCHPHKHHPRCLEEKNTWDLDLNLPKWWWGQTSKPFPYTLQRLKIKMHKLQNFKLWNCSIRDSSIYSKFK